MRGGEDRGMILLGDGGYFKVSQRSPLNVGLSSMSLCSVKKVVRALVLMGSIS